VIVELGEFQAFLRLPDGALDVAQATEMLEGAAGLVRDEIGQSLDFVEDDIWTTRPRGGTILQLPQLPVTEVTLVEERRTIAAGWVSLVEDTDYEVDLFDGTLHRLGHHEWPSSIFPRRPGGLVRVTNSHGYPEMMPDTIRTVVKRVAARGYENPEAVAQDTVGKVTTSYGAAPGLYLSKSDCADLARERPGGKGGSR
jgi:hypothetical protein